MRLVSLLVLDTCPPQLACGGTHTICPVLGDNQQQPGQAKSDLGDGEHVKQRSVNLLHSLGYGAISVPVQHIL